MLQAKHETLAESNFIETKPTERGGLGCFEYLQKYAVMCRGSGGELAWTGDERMWWWSIRRPLLLVTVGFVFGGGIEKLMIHYNFCIRFVALTVLW